MDFQEYRQHGKEMVDYIADYLQNIRDRKVFPDVKPGYMRNLLPDSAPIDGENWEAIFGDVERVIMPGVTHWQSPHMHAYFPALNSFPSLLGDMLADAINCLGFTWASSPACTELEIIVMNWLGKMIGLPDEFLHLNNSSQGGGVIQTTASESTLVALLAGRTRAIRGFHEKSPGYQDAEINARLVAYCSDQAHSSIEKAALIGLVRMRYIESDENLSMRGELLRKAIEDDTKQGLIPFWVCATLGTTGTCAFDDLEEVGAVCREYNLWLHVDAAYAGSAFICPEYRTWLKGIERADSIAFNPSKWLMVHFDCTALWVKDSTAVHRTFNVEPLYLQHENSGLAIDYMHWQIPLSKRFRSLKLWFVLRSYGIRGLQKHIREGVRLAQKFEALVLADHRFEIPARRHLGMVVFRVKGDNDITEHVLKRLNHRGNLHCVPASIKGKYVIRFTVTSSRTTTDDILKDWTEIRRVTTMILEEMNIKISAAAASAAERTKVSLKDIKTKNEAFGSSLLLSNSPMSPKIVNGSFAAIFDADEFLAKTYAGIRIAHQESPSMRRRVRGILMSGKQFSLDSHMDIVVQTCLDSSTTTTNTNAYGKTTVKSKSNKNQSNPNPNPICEDNEDGWEAYESLGTPPNSPPPQISPMLRTPCPGGSSPTLELNVSPILATVGFGVVQVQNRLTTPPKTLAILHSTTASLNKPNYIIDNTVFMHSLENTVSFSRYSDNQTVDDHNHHHHHNHQKCSPQSPSTCDALLTALPNSLQRHHNHSSNNNSTKNYHHHASQSQSSQTPHTSGQNNSTKRKNIYVYSCNSKQNTVSIKTHIRQDTSSTEEDSGHSQQAPNVVYHGKRYLDPVANFDNGCAFVNSGFKTFLGGSGYRRHHPSSVFGCALPQITEAESGSVDWEAVRNNFNSGERQRIRRGSKSFPKFRVRINDEHGHRIQSSFESSGTEDSYSPQTTPQDILSPLTIWSSFELDSTVAAAVAARVDADAADAIVSNDSWTIAPKEDGDEVNSCCEKCGHENNTTTVAASTDPSDFPTINNESISASSSDSTSSQSLEESSA